MHIGYLTPEYILNGAYDGGLANYLAKIGRQLTARGHKVSILVPSDREQTWKDEDITVFEFKKANLVPRAFLWKFNQFLPLISNILNDWHFRSQVLQIHRNSPLDLIQASSFMSPGYFLRHNGLFPLVCRVSSFSPLLREAYGFPSGRADYLRDRLEIRQALDADAVFAPSLLLAETFRKIGVVQPRVIRTPVVLDAFVEDESFYREHLSNKKYLLYFGSLSRVKGVDLLADIIPALLDKYADLHVALIGHDYGLPTGEKVFDNILRQCPLHRSRLFYHAPIAKSQLYPVIRHAQGVLVPSRVDNYPNTCLEALSCGVPVIGTDRSSLDEMIIDGKTGFLAKNGNQESIQNAVEKLLTLKDAELIDMRNNISTWVISQIHEDRVGQLIQFYREVIENYRQ